MNEGEMWLVRIDDKVELHKVVIIAKYKRAIELQDVIEGVARGPKKIISKEDVQFIEKVSA